MSARSFSTDLRRRARGAAAAGALVLLAACGGGGGGSAPVPQPPGAGVAQLVITLPSVGPSARRRSPRYVSPGTTSIAVTVNGTAVEALTITQSCTVNSAQTVAVCTYTFPAPAGSDTFAIQLLDGARNVLSSGTVTATVAGGKQPTPLHLTFGGVPARVSLQLDHPNPPVGTAANVMLTATALDAAGSLIIGDPYATPITVASNDKTGLVTLSATTLASPNDAITVRYSGRLIPDLVTFSVAAPAQPYPAGSTAVFNPNPWTGYGPTALTVRAVAPGPDGNVWFVECGSLGSACKLGNVTPAGRISEFAELRNAVGLVAGPDGNLWFTEGNQPYIGRITPSGTITQFLIPSRAPVNGDDAGPITVGPDGNLWFAEGDRIGVITPAGAVTEYLIGGLFRPKSIVTGPDGALWFSEGQQIGRITTAGVVTQFPVDNSGLASAQNLVFGPDGKLYFAAGFSVGAPLWTMTTGGVIGRLPLTPAGQTFTPSIGLGPDGRMWGLGGLYDLYSSGPTSGVSAATFAGAVTTYVAPFPQSFGTTQSLTSSGAFGPDGNLWFGNGQGLARFRYAP